MGKMKRTQRNKSADNLRKETVSSINWNDEWYVSDDFNKDVFRLGINETIRFNGKDTIIFEFGTT